MRAIRPAWPHEAAVLSALAIRSKAHWGYTPEQMRVFEAELTLVPDDLAPRAAHVALACGRIAGFYTLVEQVDQLELEHLFIDPGFMGRGLGRSLWTHALGAARGRGFSHLRIQSDPHAAGFYEAIGAHKTRDLASSIPGRTVPLFEISLR